MKTSTERPEVPIEEQIKSQTEHISALRNEGFHDDVIRDAESILASLLYVQRIQKAERPEPVAWMYRGEPSFDGKKWHEVFDTTTSKQVAFFKDNNARPLYGPELLDYADRMAAERDMWKAAHTMMKTETAEAWGARDVERDRAESAEAKLARVEKLLREPTPEMMNAAIKHVSASGVMSALGIWKAMSAELLRQIEGDK